MTTTLTEEKRAKVVVGWVPSASIGIHKQKRRNSAVCIEHAQYSLGSLLRFLGPRHEKMLCSTLPASISFTILWQQYIRNFLIPLTHTSSTHTHPVCPAAAADSSAQHNCISLHQQKLLCCCPRAGPAVVVELHLLCRSPPALCC